MDLVSVLLYGLIQGITEFLPISSSGHLALLPFFLSIQDPGILFDLSMHVGTALSVLVYFWPQVKALLRSGISLIPLLTRGKIREITTSTGEKARALNMIIATGSTLVLILAIKDLAEDHGRTPWGIAFNLFFFGALMFWADRVGKTKGQNQMAIFSPKKSLAIGFFQGLAIFPGVSRSGSTLTIARFMGLSREEATEFSFLLSLPIIFMGFFYKLPDFFQSDLAFDPLICLLGMTMSFVVGLFTIHFFLKMIKRLGLFPFALYRIFLGGILFYYLWP